MKKRWGHRAADILYTMFMKKNFVEGEKLLITTTDGIGDFIVREKIFTRLVVEQGKENVVVLAKEKLLPILKRLGIENIIVYTDEKRKKFLGRLEFLKEMNQAGIGKIISLEFDQHDTFIEHFLHLPRTGFHNSCHREMDSYYDTLIPYCSGSIIEDVLSFYRYYFKEERLQEELRPDIMELFEESDEYRGCIAIGIGSIDRRKMLSPKIFGEILIRIKKEYPYREILLLGKGELERKFIEELKTLISLEGIEDRINALSLDETLGIIKASGLYVGVDSGLYNFAFALRKKVVGIFARENRFSHSGFKDIRIVKSEREGEENYFGSREINGVDTDKIMEMIGESLKG